MVGMQPKGEEGSSPEGGGWSRLEGGPACGGFWPDAGLALRLDGSPMNDDNHNDNDMYKTP